MTSKSPPRTMTGRRRGPSGGGLCRERGQLKLSSLDPVSTRAINFQHKSMRNFLRSRPGDLSVRPSPTNNNNNTNDNNARTSILSPTEAGMEVIKKRIRISLTKSDTSDRSLELGLTLAPPKRFESSITPTDLRQILDQKVELSRQHDKKDHEMSLRWGSLKFKLCEEDLIRAPMRTSELSDSQEEFLAIEEFLNEMGEYDDTNREEEESESNNIVDIAATIKEAKEESTANAAADTTAPTSAVDNSSDALASIPPDLRPCTSDAIRDSTVEVAPGVFLPLKTPMQTWEAVEEGRVTVTTCNQCKVELTCTDDAHIVMCVDCWVFSPVDQTAFRDNLTESQSLNYKNMENGCVSVGISTEEIFEWIAIQEAAELMG